jgi:hypothetical protein
LIRWSGGRSHSWHFKLRTLTTFVNEAVDAALRDLEAALGAAGYEDEAGALS